MRILISSQYAYLVCGIRRYITEICKCFSDCEIDIFSKNLVKDDFFNQFDYVKVFDNLTLLRQHSIENDVNLYIQLGYFGKDAINYFYKELNKAVKILIPSGFEINPNVIDMFDFVTYQAHNLHLYIDRDSDKKRLIIPPILYKNKEDYCEEMGEVLGEEYFFTLFNPYPLEETQGKGFIKGQDILLGVANKINRKIAWGFSTDINDFSEYENISDNIIVLKNLTNTQIACLYKRAKAYVSFSRQEGFGWAMMDALLYDIPVVSRNIGGVTLFEEDGIYKYNNSDELANLLKKEKYDKPNIDKKIFSRERYRNEIFLLMKERDLAMKKTPLYDEHVKLGAKIVDFAGFLMPVYYNSIKEEHLLVRNKVAMFDTTHMGIVTLRSLDALNALDGCLMRTIQDMKTGSIRYNRIINDDGGVVDDILVYKTEDGYMAVFNASNIEKDIEFFKVKGIVWELIDFHIIAVQGPESFSLLNEFHLGDIEYYNFAKKRVFDQDILVSRTGYTGEDGVELMVPESLLGEFWQRLLELGVNPAGLGARDSLRIEAGMPLYGHELKDNWSSKKSNRVQGIELLDKGMMRGSYQIFDTLEAVDACGVVTSATYSPTLEKSIGIFMPEKDIEIGAEVYVNIRGQKKKAVIRKLPFVNKNRK